MSPSNKQSTSQIWLYIGALIIIIVIFFFPLLNGSDFIWFDFINQHIPRNLYIAQHLAQWHLPQWDITAYGGYPFLADPENAVFYPFNWLLTLAPKSLLALQKLVVIETLFAALFTFFCVKELNGKNQSALFGALAFVLSTPFICRFMNYGHFTIIVFIPAVIFFLLKWARLRNFKYSISAGLMLGISFLGGNPQYMYFLCIVVFLHFLCEFAYEIKNKTSAKTLLNLFMGYIVIAAIALGVSAINLIPIAEFFSISQRGTENMAAGTGTPIKNFATYFVPYFFGKVAGGAAPYWGKGGFWNYWEYSQYIGILPFLLAIISPFIIRKRRALFFGVLIVFAWVYAYGENNPLPAMIPFGKSMRIPGKFFIFAGFSFAVLSALVLDKIIKLKIKFKNFNVLLYIFAAAGLLLLFYGFIFKAHPVPGIQTELIQEIQSGGIKIAGFLIILSSTLILTFGKWKKKLPVYLLASPFIFLLLADDFYFNRNFNSSKQNPEKIYQNVYQLKQLKKDTDNEFIRIDGRPFTSGNLKALYYGLNSLDGFSALITQNMQSFRSLRGKNEKIFNFLYGVKYKFAVVPPGRLSLQRIPRYSPKAYIVRKIKLLPENEITGYLGSTNFDYKSEVVITEGKPEVYGDGIKSKNDVVEILNYTPEKISLNVFLDSPGILVMSENALPGWTVYVDGKRQEMLIVNLCFRAVKLDKGKYEVVWKYTTPGLKLGAVISGITILLAAFIISIPSRFPVILLTELR
ncbi:YfhO family protein [bacterium]|nr:YfhO family protein [bacterium]